LAIERRSGWEQFAAELARQQKDASAGGSSPISAQQA
jgi:hypothetical protein